MGSGLATSDALSGMSSSLAFTPIQGIELVNPNAEKESRDSQSGTDSVFNDKEGSLPLRILRNRRQRSRRQRRIACRYLVRDFLL